MCADLVAQIDQIIAGEPPDLIHIRRMPVPWNDIGRAKGFERVVPCVDPVGRVRIRKQRQHAFVKRHIPRNHQALFRQPDRDIPRTMRRTQMQHLNRDIAKGHVIAVLEHFGRSLGTTITGIGPGVILHTAQDFVAVRLEFLGRIHMGQNRYALIHPIAVAQHRVPLTVFIDHKAHGLIGHRTDFIVQRRGQRIIRPRIHHNDPIAGDHKGQVVVMACVGLTRRCGGPDGRKHVRDHLNRFRIKGRAWVLVRDILAGQCGQGGQNRRRAQCRCHHKTHHHHSSTCSVC